MPKKIIEINKRNFNNIGELGINTNPKAELCNYLILYQNRVPLWRTRKKAERSLSIQQTVSLIE